MCSNKYSYCYFVIEVHTIQYWWLTLLRYVVLICCDRMAEASKYWANMLGYVVLTCCDRLAGASEFINWRQI